MDTLTGTKRHTRVLTACEACRLSKTRCDSARPVCDKCAKRGVPCAYPETDPLSVIESWSSKILKAVERQERRLEDHLRSLTPWDSESPESISRNDTLKTPITGSDMILSWPIFPPEKPVPTFPSTAFAEKHDPYLPVDTPDITPHRICELRLIFMTRIRTKNPIVDADQLDECIARVLENGFDWSVSSCLVLLVFALAAIWGNYPEPDARESAPGYLTLEVPKHRMQESIGFFSMARKRMSSAYLDGSAVGIQCFCLFGMWYQYNIEPIAGWKAFRTASMLWQTYHLKCRDGSIARSEQEESLEQRLYWTCLKSECEIRYELTDLPPCDLSLSDYPFSLPSFPHHEAASPGPEDHETLSSYYYLAEISLRRLLNRVRHAVTILSPSIGRSGILQLSDTLHDLGYQLQQWVDCLPPALHFNKPLLLRPPIHEPELMKLARERYVEVRELLCRAHLYLCIHVQLDQDLLGPIGEKASEALQLSVYRIETELPFFRHPGSWGACRVRFNHALCLIAAWRAKQQGMVGMECVTLPDEWATYVRVVIERLRVWEAEGAGIRGLRLLLDWLMGL